jgi:hypothetical protein
MKVKVFQNFSTPYPNEETGVDEVPFEVDINNWLADNKVKVINVSFTSVMQASSPTCAALIFYEEV